MTASTATPVVAGSGDWTAAIRIRLQMANRIRDLALFNLAIDSKPRSCDPGQASGPDNAAPKTPKFSLGAKISALLPISNRMRFAAVFDESGEARILLYRGRFTERIVKDGDLRLISGGVRRCRQE